MPLIMSPEYMGVGLPSAAPLSALITPIGNYSGRRSGGSSTSKEEDAEFNSKMLTGDAYAINSMKAQLEADKQRLANEIYTAARESGDYESFITSGKGLQMIQEAQKGFMQRELMIESLTDPLMRFKDQYDKYAEDIFETRKISPSKPYRDMQGKIQYYKNEDGKWLDKNGKVTENLDERVPITVGDVVNRYQEGIHFNPQTGRISQPEPIVIEDQGYYFEKMDEYLEKATESEIRFVDENGIERTGYINEQGQFTESNFTNDEHIKSAYRLFLRNMNNDPVLQKTYYSMLNDYTERKKKEDPTLKDEDIKQMFIQETSNEDTRYKLIDYINQEPVSAEDPEDPEDVNWVQEFMFNPEVVIGAKKMEYPSNVSIRGYNIVSNMDEFPVEDNPIVKDNYNLFVDYAKGIGFDEFKDLGPNKKTAYVASLLKKYNIPDTPENISIYRTELESAAEILAGHKSGIDPNYSPDARNAFIEEMISSNAKLFAFRHLVNNERADILYPKESYFPKNSEGQTMIYSPKDGSVTFDVVTGTYETKTGRKFSSIGEGDEIRPGEKFLFSAKYQSNPDDPYGPQKIIPGTDEYKTASDLESEDWIPLTQLMEAATITPTKSPITPWRVPVTDPNKKEAMSLIGTQITDLQQVFFNGSWIDIQNEFGQPNPEIQKLFPVIVDVDALITGFDFNGKTIPAAEVVVAFNTENKNNVAKLFEYQVTTIEDGEFKTETRIPGKDDKDLEDDYGWFTNSVDKGFSFYKEMYGISPYGWNFTRKNEGEAVFVRLIVPYDMINDIYSDDKRLMWSGILKQQQTNRLNKRAQEGQKASDEILEYH